MKNFGIVIFLLILSIPLQGNAQDAAKYVDPFIGTGGHGHTFPGASLPFGMVQVSPDTRTGNWDACGGYYYADKSIIGFSHQHLSGVGCLDYGDILFMPTTGEIQLVPGDEKNTAAGYRSKFLHSSEKAEPGYYSVILTDHSIKAELTVTMRAAFHKYTYLKSEDANLIIDLTHQLETGENVKELEFRIVDNNKIEGLRRSNGWAADQMVYFAAEFSEPVIEHGIQNDGKIFTDIMEAKGNNIKAYLKFKLKDKEPLLIKVGISAVDYEGARKNLTAEIPGWDFDKVRKDAKAAWNKELSKIVIKDKSLDKKKIFYTALYHAFLVPNTYFDVDRRYRGNDRQIHTCSNFDNYTVFSLWDTFRSTHPLYVLLNPQRDDNMIKSMLAKYDQSGMLPKWDLAGNETGTMIGYHAIPVITDAYIKGIRDFDINKALKAMQHSAYESDPEMKLYIKYGYVPSDRKIESVSKTLEYAYDDWAIYRFAKETGNKDVAKEFLERSKYYINLFDGSTGFFRGKNINGNWVAKLDPFEITRDYTEGNAWQYSMFAPHDMNGLINLYGGREKFISHLDKLFTEKTPSDEAGLSDVTGFIGQYAHGNEPSHHMAYIYNFAGQPWKTQMRIHQILKDFYTTKPDGLIGNEDCGQMSSWFNFSSMGLYPFCPGTDEYQIGTPYFDEVIIKLDNGKNFVIKAKNLSDENYYIQSVILNGKEHPEPFIKHSDIINGGELIFKMGDKPNKKWGSIDNIKPYSLTNEKFTSIPFAKENIAFFANETKAELGCKTDGAKIHYTLDDSAPVESSQLYKKPLAIKETVTLKARAFKKGFAPGPVMKIEATKAEFYKAADIPESSLVNGVEYKYCEGSFTSAYDVQKAEVKKSGVLNNFGLEPAQIEDHYGFVFSGYIYIPESDIYNFYTKSDDGSVLLIDDKEIVNNDGSHGAIAAFNVTALEKGFHPFKLLYFEDYEGNSIEMGWENNKIPQQTIPVKNLFVIKK